MIKSWNVSILNWICMQYVDQLYYFHWNFDDCWSLGIRYVSFSSNQILKWLHFHKLQRSLVSRKSPCQLLKESNMKCLFFIANFHALCSNYCISTRISMILVPRNSLRQLLTQSNYEMVAYAYSIEFQWSLIIRKSLSQRFK